MNEEGTAEKTKIVGVTGMPGSGKGEVSDIARSLGLEIRSLGDVVRNWFSADHPSRPLSELGTFADEERDRFGKDIWARRLIDEVDDLVSEERAPVLIDGVRSSFEVDLFEERWGDGFSVLCIHSSPATRFERLSRRGRGDDPLARADFEERDRRELRWGLGEVIARADMMIVNEGPIDDLRTNSRELLEVLMR